MIDHKSRKVYRQGRKRSIAPQFKKGVSRPFLPGCPTGAVDHVDKDARPHVLKRTDVKVEPDGK